MDQITAAIIAALSAGVLSGLTETSKTAITSAYHALKDLLVRKFGAGSEIAHAIGSLETKPNSASRQGTLQEEIVAAKAKQDDEVLAAARHLLTLIHAQQAGGKFTIQNIAPVQGQTVGDHNTITQRFGDLPKI